MPTATTRSDIEQAIQSKLLKSDKAEANLELTVDLLQLFTQGTPQSYLRASLTLVGLRADAVLFPRVHTG